MLNWLKKKIGNFHIEQKIKRICRDVKDVEKELVKAGLNRGDRRKYWKELIRLMK